jgi:hypothetical protein
MPEVNGQSQLQIKKVNAKKRQRSKSQCQKVNGRSTTDVSNERATRVREYARHVEAREMA